MTAWMAMGSAPAPLDSMDPTVVLSALHLQAMLATAMASALMVPLATEHVFVMTDSLDLAVPTHVPEVLVLTNALETVSATMV